MRYVATAGALVAMVYLGLKYESAFALGCAAVLLFPLLD